MIASPSRGRELAWALGSAALSAVIAVLYFGLQHRSLHVPLVLDADAPWELMKVKSVLDHGWFLHNPDLGWPGGSDLHDQLQGGNNANYALIWLIGLFTSDAALAANLFFLLQFPLIAGVAYAVLRRLEVSSPPAAVLSCLFAVLPYHLVRNEHHLMLGMYVAIPVLFLLVIRVLEDRPLFTRRRGREGPLAWLSARSLVVAGACALIASTGSTYYPAFAIALLVLCAPLAAAAHRSLRPLVTAGVLCALLAGVLALNLAPSVVYRLQHGANPAAFKRVPEDTEYYGFNVQRLLLPPPDHRFAPARDLGERIQLTTHLPEAGEHSAYLGVVAGAGVVLLMLLGLARIAGAPIVHRHFANAGIVAAWVFVIGTTGGIAAVFAYLVTPTLHSPNRIELVLAFAGLLAAGVALDLLRTTRIARRGGTPLAVAALLAVLAVGVYDQATLPRDTDPAPIWASDGRLVSAIEERLPRGSAVFQLPIQSITGERKRTGRIAGFDPLLPYLHSHGLRWSFGAPNGRQENWQAAFVHARLDELLPAVGAVGFSGLLIDRFGYSDPGDVERRAGQALGTAPLVSPDQRFVFFDMRRYDRALRRRRGAAELAALRHRVLTTGTRVIPLPR